MKSIRRIIRDIPQHWVGDGFPVRSLFSYQDENAFDPFLLLDYAGPHTFAPAEATRGVGEHPHRGFETVTIVYQGELEHRDSSGSHGTIDPGDVQWMTAANEQPLAAVELGVLERAGTQVRLEAASSARILMLTGRPIGEPVVGQGPFVMNTREEIREAIQDYQAGRMGQLS